MSIDVTAGIGTVIIESTQDNIENNPKDTSKFWVGINSRDKDVERTLCGFTIPSSMWRK